VNWWHRIKSQKPKAKLQSGPPPEIRAFSPDGNGSVVSRGVGPGWFGTAPLALAAETVSTITAPRTKAGEERCWSATRCDWGRPSATRGDKRKVEILKTETRNAGGGTPADAGALANRPAGPAG
jgi:hypothetical protein